MVTENIQMWATGAGVSLAIGLVLRFAKKNNWGDRCKAMGERCGILISAALLGWLPRSKAEQAEEGLIVTALSWFAQFLLGVEKGILKDNEKKTSKKKDLSKRPSGRNVLLLLLVPALMLSVGCSKKITKLQIAEIEETTIEAPASLVNDGYVSGVLDFADEVESPVAVQRATILFKFDSFRLAPVECLKIDQLKLGDKVVYLKGGACPIGPERYNYDLGIKRALEVMRYFIEVLGAVDVRWESVGENDLVSKSNYDLNRRCEVEVR